MGELLHADLTYVIRGVLMDVHNKLGPMRPEAACQEAIAVGLEKRRLCHTLEQEFHVYYRGVEVGRYRSDVFVDDKVLLELKVVPALTPLNRAQLLSYMRVSDADVGLLVNFGTPRLEIERYANFFACRRPDFAWQSVSFDSSGLLYADLVGQLYEALHRVHYELGPGFFHHVYRRAFRVELDAQNVVCSFIRELPIYYEGQYVGSQSCRLLVVEDSILVAAFAVRQVTEAYEGRMRRYLSQLGLKLGLLANFHGMRLDVRPVRLPG